MRTARLCVDNLAALHKEGKATITVNDTDPGDLNASGSFEITVKDFSGDLADDRLDISVNLIGLLGGLLPEGTTASIYQSFAETGERYISNRRLSSLPQHRVDQPRPLGYLNRDRRGWTFACPFSLPRGSLPDQESRAGRLSCC